MGDGISDGGSTVVALLRSTVLTATAALLLSSAFQKYLDAQLGAWRLRWGVLRGNFLELLTSCKGASESFLLSDGGAFAIFALVALPCLLRSVVLSDCHPFGQMREHALAKSVWQMLGVTGIPFYFWVPFPGTVSSFFRAPQSFIGSLLDKHVVDNCRKWRRSFVSSLYNKHADGVDVEEMVRKKNCPGGHGLLSFTTPEGAYFCNACDGTMAKGATAYGCRSCDYDICTSCSTDRLWSVHSGKRRNNGNNPRACAGQ